MNNSSDNKDLTPEVDDAVWLKDIALADAPSTILNIAAGETVALASVPADTTAITGEGTLYCGASLPDAKYGFTDAAWKGTVVFEGLNNETATQNFKFEEYGNGGSSIRLVNCAIQYLAANNATFAGVLELEGSPAFSTNNGYSNNYNVIGELRGSGSMTFTTAQSQAYVFNAATNFTGSINIDAAMNSGSIIGRRIVFGQIAGAYDLPSQAATVTVKPGAAAAIGGGATWYAHHGVDIAGTLIVKGALATLDCEENGAAMGLKLEDGATIRFDAAEASLAFAQKCIFASGTVNIVFGDGVAPAAKRQKLISWNEKPGGNFALTGLDGCYLEVLDDGVYAVKTKPANSMDIGGAGAYIAWDAALENWMEKRGYNPEPEEWEEELTWQEFMQRKAANGYSRWACYVLGLDRTWLADDTLKARVEIDAVAGKVKIITAEDARSLDGVVLWTSLYGSETLISPLPFIEKVKGTSIERPAGEAGFYRVEVSFEPQ